MDGKCGDHSVDVVVFGEGRGEGGFRGIPTVLGMGQKAGECLCRQASLFVCASQPVTRQHQTASFWLIAPPMAQSFWLIAPPPNPLGSLPPPHSPKVTLPEAEYRANVPRLSAQLSAEHVRGVHEDALPLGLHAALKLGCVVKVRGEGRVGGPRCMGAGLDGGASASACPRREMATYHSSCHTSLPHPLQVHQPSQSKSLAADWTLEDFQVSTRTAPRSLQSLYFLHSSFSLLLQSSSLTALAPPPPPPSPPQMRTGTDSSYLEGEGPDGLGPLRYAALYSSWDAAQVRSGGGRETDSVRTLKGR